MTKYRQNDYHAYTLVGYTNTQFNDMEMHCSKLKVYDNVYIVLYERILYCTVVMIIST